MMDKIKLEELYDEATPEKLAEMFDRAINFKEQYTKLKNKSDDIVENISTTIHKRFDKICSSKEELKTAQLIEMSRQWNIMSASLMKVKSSIKLSGFHSDLNLYISPSYGIKEYKRCVKYSPFHSYNIPTAENAERDKRRPYKYQEEKLLIAVNVNRYNVLDFKVLKQISQLDQSRINSFIEITKDIVYMTDSWYNFYKVKTNSQLYTAFDSIKRISSYNMMDYKEKYQTDLLSLDKIIEFRTQLSIDMAKQVTRWESTLNKWKEINKNFLVLNELRKFELKI